MALTSSKTTWCCLLSSSLWIFAASRMTPFSFTLEVRTERKRCPPFLAFLDGLKLIASLDHSVGHRRAAGIKQGVSMNPAGTEMAGEKVTVYLERFDWFLTGQTPRWPPGWTLTAQPTSSFASLRALALLFNWVARHPLVKPSIMIGHKKFQRGVTRPCETVHSDWSKRKDKVQRGITPFSIHSDWSCVHAPG